MLLLFVVSICSISTNAQKLYTTNADKTVYSLTLTGANTLAELPLKCLLKEYPNKTGHTSASDSDHIITPQKLHPTFYGCFDWHSSVHGHWMLIKLLKLFPNMEKASHIRSVLNTTITAKNITDEINYFNDSNAKSWERTYGWAWLLKLQEELITWDDVDGQKWNNTIQPLTDTIIQLWKTYLPKQTYPSRSGTHGNTAFGLNFALDYARTAKDKAFEKALIKSAKSLFAKDKNIPATWEPNGADFFSPALQEADLMRKVLPKSEFIKWFNTFLTKEGLQRVMEIPTVSDRSDYQIVHLDGLCFTRSWCMRSIAKQLPLTDIRRKQLLQSSVKLLNTSLPQVTSGNYGGEHWLASFAVFAITN